MRRTLTKALCGALAVVVLSLLGACSDGADDNVIAAPTSVPVTTTALPGTDREAAAPLAAATTCRQLLDATEPQLTSLLDALVARAAALQPAEMATLSMPDLPEFQSFVAGTANLEAEAARVNCSDVEQRRSVCDVLTAAMAPDAPGGQMVLQLLRSGC